MQMGEGLDTGPVALVEKVAITPDTTAGILHDQLMDISGPLAVKAIEMLEAGELTLTEQSDEGVTYAKKIEKSETRIDFSKDGARVHKHIMGLSPFLGAWFELGEGKKAARVKVLASKYIDYVDSAEAGTVIDDTLTIACGEGAIALVELQKAGSKPMKVDEFLCGNSIPKGTKLS